MLLKFLERAHNTLGDASMKLKFFNIHTNWLTLRFECVESKNKKKLGSPGYFSGYMIINKTNIMKIISFYYFFSLLLNKNPCIWWHKACSPKTCQAIP